MKMIINTATTHKGGGVQVAYSFIEECKRFDKHEFHVVLGKMLADMISEREFPRNFSFYRIGYRPATRVLRTRSHDRFFRDLEETIQPDVVFTTSGPAYWRPKAPHLVGYNLPHYIYRDSPFFAQIPFIERLKWDLKGAVIKYFFKKDADAYVVQTDDVNARLKVLLKSENVYTVSNTYSRHYINPGPTPNRLPERKADEFRLLTLSAWYPHKNLNIIPSVIDALTENMKENVRFVLTLPDDVFRKEFPGRYQNNIMNVGPVKPEHGPALYRECDALFLPTLLECFSASYAEAMVMELPIITSDLGFARSVCKDAALYADPLNPDDYAKKINELINNFDLRKNLIENGLKNLKQFSTAAERANKYITICRKLADANKN